MAAIEGSVSIIDVQPTTPSRGEGRCRSAVCADSRSPPHFEHPSCLVGERHCKAILRQLPS